MTDRPPATPSAENAGAKRPPRVAVLWCWAFLMAAADLKMAIGGYIHWFVTAAAVALTFPALVRGKAVFPARALVPALGLSASVLLAAVTSPDLFYGVAQTFKLLVILLGGIAIFSNSWENVAVTQRAFVWNVGANLVLLFAGLGGVNVAASEMAPGRWGTFLCYPGSLWRSGMAVVGYGLYLALTASGRRLHGTAVGLGGLALVVADGSRTALLLLPICIVMMGYVLLRRSSSRARVLAKAWVTALALVAVTGLAFLVARSSDQDESGGGTARLGALVVALQGGGLEGLGDADPTRFAMLADAVARIREDPLLGGGIGTTRSMTDEKPMEVHNTYLQVWADLGLLGFVSFVSLVVGGTAMGLRNLRRLDTIQDPMEAATSFGGAFVLVSFGVTALFHPLSTEWPEWLPFLMAFGLHAGVLNARTGPPAVKTA